MEEKKRQLDAKSVQDMRDMMIIKVAEAGRMDLEEASKLLESCGWIQATAMQKIWQNN